MIPLLWQELKILMKVKAKLNIQTTKIVAAGPITWRIFQFVVIHTDKGFGIVNKVEVDDFLDLSCFCNDPADVGNLISDSSAFSKSILNIWKFLVHVLEHEVEA